MKTNTIEQNLLPPIARPDLDDTLNALKLSIFFNLNCHRVGVIQSFDTNKQTATIQLVDAWTDNSFQGNKSTPLPPLIHCPIIILKNKNGGLTCPITKGDECLVFFNDRDLDNWQTAGGEYQIPATARAHSLTDAMAIVGLHSYANSISDYNNDATELNFKDSKISLSDDEVSITSTQGTEIVMDDKFKLSNETQDLKTLVDQLINILLNLKTTPDGGVTLYPIDSTTSTNLTTILANFNLLLK